MYTPSWRCFTMSVALRVSLYSHSICSSYEIPNLKMIARYKFFSKFSRTSVTDRELGKRSRNGYPSGEQSSKSKRSHGTSSPRRMKIIHTRPIQTFEVRKCVKIDVTRDLLAEVWFHISVWFSDGSEKLPKTGRLYAKTHASRIIAIPGIFLETRRSYGLLS